MKGSLLGVFLSLLFFLINNFNVVRSKENKRRMAVTSFNSLLVTVACLTSVNYPLISLHRTSE